MKYCDENGSILEWASEEVVIPYFSNVDQKTHRYFVDFWIKIKEKNGDIRCKLIEIKPHNQTIQPKLGKKATPKYMREVKKWIINNNKWEAATKYCKEKDWEFLILTEKHLFKERK